MPSETTSRIYVSMPKPFLEAVDELAAHEHQSRSAVIREALKLYMRNRRQMEGLVAMTEELRTAVGPVDESTLEADIDRAVADARRQRRRP